MGLLDNFTNWAQSSQSQPAADGLLAAGLGILANNRGLTSGTQAIGMGGLQGLQAYQGSKRLAMDQQLQNAQLQQLQYGLQNNKMFMDVARSYLGGGDPSQGQPQVAAAPTGAPAGMGGVPDGSQGSGPGAAPMPMGTGGPPQGGGAPPMQPPAQMPPQMPQGAPQGAMPPQGGASPMSGLFGNIPKPLVAMGLLRDPNKTIESAMSQYSPTDLEKTMRAAGIDPKSTIGQQILQASIAKTNNIPPVSGRPGGYLTYADGRQEQLPQVPEGFTAQKDQNGQWQMVPVAGGTAAMTASSGAKAAGTAGYQLTPTWDPTANGGKGGMVQQTVANVASAANGGAQPAPAPIRANNPGAMMPGGKLATYPTMQAGLDSMDTNLQSYGKQGVNTLAGVISKWAPPSANNTPAYIQDVSQRLGLQPNQQIDLSNPLVRHAISAGIALHENGPGGVFGQPGAQGAPAQPQGGAFAAAPPLGMTTATDASQGAPSKLMSDSYSGLSTADANYQQSRDALNHMIDLAHNKGPGGTAVGLLPESVGTKISPDAATYQKLHATYVALQGKALGGGGTDASRATIDEAVPTYDKPQTAMVGGLTTQLNNLDLSHVKTQFLTPIYQAGNEKTYTQQSAAFDQNVKPSMVPVLTLSGDAQRAAVQAAVKANPALRSNFEWAFSNGLLK